jgi:cob(I)alamin adenosyltransferase
MPKIAKSMIYTKKGDTGKSCLSDRKERNKCDVIFACLGEIDELNTRIGLLVCSIQKKLPLETELCDFLIKVQHSLMTMSSILAMPKDADESLDEYVQKMIDKKLVFHTDVTLPMMEKIIDGIDAECSRLTNFIIPGGSKLSCKFHSCRTQCRAAERLLVRYHSLYVIYEIGEVPILAFMNRLSDLFFVAARYANRRLSVEDVLHTVNS